MRKIGYYVVKVLSRFSKNPREMICQYFRRGGAVIGKNCAISSNLDLCDKHMLVIGANTIISSDVLFVTHDASFALLGDKTKSLFGKIEIGNNCFVGERTTILYGVKIPDNVIIGAGSVVTRSFSENNIIVAGNPARKISTWDSYRNKYSTNGMLLSETYEAAKLNDKRLIIRNPK